MSFEKMYFERMCTNKGRKIVGNGRLGTKGIGVNFFFPSILLFGAMLIKSYWKKMSYHEF